MSFLDRVEPREARNEKVKLIAHTLQSFGVAVTVALLGTLFTSGFSEVVVLAGLIAIMLLVMAYNVPGFLEGDEP